MTSWPTAKPNDVHERRSVRRIESTVAYVKGADAAAVELIAGANTAIVAATSWPVMVVVTTPRYVSVLPLTAVTVPTGIPVRSSSWPFANSWVAQM